MRLSDSSPSRQSLEQSFEKLMVAPSAVRHSAKGQGQWVRSLLRQILNFLAGKESIQIQQRCDRSGSLYWVVYDPHLRNHLRFDSEQEVRVWLEQRYRQ